MINTNKLEKLFPYLKGIKNDTDIFTPFKLVEEMLDKLPSEIWADPNKKFIDISCGRGTFLICIYNRLFAGLANVIPDEEKRKNHIIHNQIYGIDIDKINVLLSKKYLLGCSNITCDDSLKHNYNDMKFDVVIGNPPYNNNLHIKFFIKAFNISKRFVLFIHPSTWIFNDKPSKKYNSVKEMVKNHIVNFTLINAFKAFEGKINLNVPICITFLDKDLKNEKVLVVDEESDNKTIYENIFDINKYGNSPIAASLKNKILTLSNVDNLDSHKNTVGKYFVGLTKTRGNISKNGSGKVNDFYTFLPRGELVTEKQEKSVNYGFQSKNEAENFIFYLKTFFVRYALSIFKIKLSLHRGEMKAVPWLDFTQEWDDEKLFKHFNLTKEEIKFIYDHIPEYYPEVKKVEIS